MQDGTTVKVINVVSIKQYGHCLVSKCLLQDNLSISCNQPRVRYSVVILEAIQGQSNHNFMIIDILSLSFQLSILLNSPGMHILSCKYFR